MGLGENSYLGGDRTSSKDPLSLKTELLEIAGGKSLIQKNNKINKAYVTVFNF